MAKAKSPLKATNVAARATPLAKSEIFDVSVGKLVFTSEKHGLSTGVGDVLVDGHVKEPMQGAMALELDLLDRDYEALNSGIFGHRVSAVLDGVPFRLTTVSIIEEFKLRAIFEHALIAEMREHSKPLKASRHSMTRAEFILMMLRELRQPYTFICPELHRKQPVAKQPVSKKKQQEEEGVVPLKAASRQPAVSHPPKSSSLPSLKVKTATATEAQLEQAAILLGVVVELGGNDLCARSIICAAIGESDLEAKTTPNPLGFWGVLQGSSGKDHRWPAYWPDPTDSAGMARSWCKGGKGFIIGGLALSALRLPPGEIATKVEGSGEPENFYGQYEPQAKAIVKAFNGGELVGFTGAGSGGATKSSSWTIKTSTFEYERGQPGQTEDTFTCAQRLASEVGWSFFVAGPRSIYLVNDDDLLRAAPRYKITPKSKGLVGLVYDVEVGHRTVVIHGKRQPKPSMAELTARMDRWAAPPGCVVELEDFGPGDGKWLVEMPERSLYEADGTVHLRAPAKPLEEPPWEVSQTTLSSGPEGQNVKGVPSGIPAPQAGQYRNPPSQGPVGTGTFQGFTVAKWIIPMLEYAKAHGWKGSITSGYRPGVDPHTTSGGSEHAGTQYPHGAVDFGGPEAFGERAAFFAHVDGYGGLPLIPAQFGPYSAYPQGDGGHASGTGH